MNIFRRRKSNLNPLAFSSPCLKNYHNAVLKRQLTSEAFIICHDDGQESVLKTYNSYVSLPEQKIRCFLSSLDKVRVGSRVLVNRSENGELVGVFQP